MEDILTFKCPSCGKEISVKDDPLQVICPACKAICKGYPSVIVHDLWSLDQIKEHLSKIVEADAKDCVFEDKLYFLPLIMVELTSTLSIDLPGGDKFNDTKVIAAKNLYGDPINTPEELREFCHKVEIQYPQAADLENLPVTGLPEITREYPDAVFIPSSTALLNAPELMSDTVELRDKHFQSLCEYGSKAYNDEKRFQNYRSETYKSSVSPNGRFYLFPIHAGSIQVTKNGQTQTFRYKFHATNYAMCEEVVDDTSHETYVENQPYGFNDFSSLISSESQKKALIALSPWLVFGTIAIVVTVISGFFTQPFTEAIAGPIGAVLVGAVVLGIPFGVYYFYYNFKLSKHLLPFKNSITTPIEAIGARQQIQAVIDSISYKRGIVFTLVCMALFFIYICTQSSN